MTAFHPSTAAWLVLNAGATFRLTRLTTRDTITERPRQWIKRRKGNGWYDFVTCPWCTSIWIAGGVVALTWAAPRAWMFPAAVLTFSAVAGFLSER